MTRPVLVYFSDVWLLELVKHATENKDTGSWDISLKWRNWTKRSINVTNVLNILTKLLAVLLLDILFFAKKFFLLFHSQLMRISLIIVWSVNWNRRDSFFCYAQDFSELKCIRNRLKFGMKCISLTNDMYINVYHDLAVQFLVFTHKAKTKPSSFQDNTKAVLSRWN